MNYLLPLVFAYIKYYNMIIGERRCFYVEKYFSKYKWTDLFWILFVILTCLYIGNSLFPLNHQEISFRGSLWGHIWPYITYCLLISLLFRIENKNGEVGSLNVLDFSIDSLKLKFKNRRSF